jgi:hypothetical protein
MKIDKKIFKKGIIISAIVVFLVYFIFLIYSINKKQNEIRETENKIEMLLKNINQEIKTQQKIENSSKDFLKTAYFDKKEKFFENYIRNIFYKYKIKIDIYQSKLDEKEYAEIDLVFNADAFAFFNLVKDIENNEKIIVIKRLSVTKANMPVLKTSMSLGGYYKE